MINTEKNVQKHDISLQTSVIFVCPSKSWPSIQRFSSIGSHYMGHKIRALSRWALKLKLVQRFAIFFFFREIPQVDILVICFL